MIKGTRRTVPGGRRKGREPSASDPAERARAFLYAFLAQGFSYPTPEGAEDLANALSDLPAALRALGLDHAPRGLAAAVEVAGTRLRELEGVHNALFATSPAAPARETAYEIDKTARRAAELADVEGFYRAFGIRLKEPVDPDGLVPELEFLGILVHKRDHLRATGDEEGRRVSADAYRSFLGDHLGRWYRPFIERLEGATEKPLYVGLAGLLSAFLDREVSALGPPPARIPSRPEEPGEGGDSPCPAGCAELRGNHEWG